MAGSTHGQHTGGAAAQPCALVHRTGPSGAGRDDAGGSDRADGASELTDEDLAEAIDEQVRAIARQQALLAALLSEADTRDLAAHVGAASTAGWLRAATRQTGTTCTRQVRLARDLTGHPATEDAWRQGVVLAHQAAETHLLGEAASHDAKALRVLGPRLLEVIAPDLAEQQEARRVEREVKAAARRTHLTTFDDGKGTMYGEFRIPSRDGAMLHAALSGFLNPARTDTDGRARASADLQGEAFCQLLERYPADRLPDTGGVNATVVVTLDLDTLSADSRPQASSAPTCASPLPKRAGSPAPPASSPPSSAPPPRSSTSAAAPAATPRPNASPSP
jgi:hypothetical protein